MRKYYGEIGFAIMEETKPGVYIPKTVKRFYYGDIIKNTRKLQTTSNLNDDINISNDFSIISDPFSYENFHNIKYLIYLDTKWKVTSVEVQYPRLLLSVGGVYNEQED